MAQAVVNLQQRRDRAPAPAAGQRFDMYALIHKGVRACLADTQGALGRLDAFDPAVVTQVGAQVREVLGLVRSHMHHENQYLHPALEVRRRGASRRSATDHVAHEKAIEEIEAALLATERADAAIRAQHAHLLYQRFSLFVAEQLEHMHQEETENNQLLWQAYTDAELLQIHDALLQAIPADEVARAMRWIVPAVTPAERAQMLGAIQEKTPARIFATTLDSLRPHLAPLDWIKLTAAIGPGPFVA